MTPMSLNFQYRSIRTVITSLLVCLVANFVADAVDAKQPPAPELPQRMSQLEGLENPQTGEKLESLDPLTAESRKETRKADALAKYMVGRISVERRRVPAAIEAFTEAIKLDPESIDSYQALVPILISSRRVEEAESYTLQATKKTDDGYQLVVFLAMLYARQTQIDKAIELLEKSMGTRSVQPGSKEEVFAHRDLGHFHRMNQAFDKAAAEYKLVFERVTSGELDESALSEVIKEPGKNLDEFGDTFLKANQPELALRAYEEASKYREAKPGLHSFNLATVLHQTGKSEEALGSLQEYFDANLQSRGRAPYALLEEILEKLGRQEELIPQLKKLHEQDQSNDPLGYFLADQLRKSGDLAAAKELYLKGRDEVSDPRAMVGMMPIYRNEGEIEKLFGVLVKALQSIPRGDDEDTLNRLDDDLRAVATQFESELDDLKEDENSLNAIFDHARSLKAGDEPTLEFVAAYYMGKIATEADATDAAVEFYKYAISMRNDPPALLYQELGSHLLDAERYEEAITVLNEAVEHPSDGLQENKWLFLFFLSYGYEFKGDTDKALEVVDAALAVVPEFRRGRLEYQKAWVHYHAKDWDKAIALFNKILETYANDFDLVKDTQFRLSNVYVELGDMQKGEQALEEVLKTDPENVQANNDLGYLWADQGKNLDRAEEMIQKAISAEPENPAYLDSMGWVLFKKGNYEKAAEYLQKATQIKHGDDSTIFDHLGDALHQLGKTTEAQANFEKALEIEKGKDHPSEKLLKSIQEKIKPASE